MDRASVRAYLRAWGVFRNIDRGIPGYVAHDIYQTPSRGIPVQDGYVEENVVPVMQIIEKSDPDGFEVMRQMYQFDNSVREVSAMMSKSKSRIVEIRNVTEATIGGYLMGRAA